VSTSSAWKRSSIPDQTGRIVVITGANAGETGVELTFATNHLGHFAFTGLLLDRILAANGSRIVTVSSNAHKRGEARFDDLGSEQNYSPGRAYDRSKLANLLFTLELQRRLSASRTTTIAVVAHPGNARTDLWRTSSWLERVLLGARLRHLTRRLAQEASEAALPILRAATDPVVGGVRELRTGRALPIHGPACAGRCRTDSARSGRTATSPGTV
jgi:NAD(P)-dependent dehydrogenase (short-subunit alcohol dehydrogenase family)